MKKIFWSLLFVSALFVGCGDDDDEDSNSSDNGKKETVDNDKVTKDNCLSALKKNYGFDLQLPSTSTISAYNDFLYDWAVSIKSSNPKEDALAILNSLFEQSKSLSTEGVYCGEFDYDDETEHVFFNKKKDANSLEDALQSYVATYYQYDWFYKSSKGFNIEVFVDYDEEKGSISIGID